MLEVQHLSKAYGRLVSVRELNFTLNEGETVGLIGPNGAGKSTTMKMLAGSLAPTAGTVLLDGLSMLEQPRAAKRLVGYLPEIPPLYPDHTVTEQLRFVCALKGLARAEWPAECKRVCELLNLTEVAGRLNSHLSKGYRQRVGFAAALIGHPRLLILDEPTVGLDPQQILDVRRLILTLSKQMTVLISSHILSEIATVCSRVLIMDHGELKADGAPAEIEARYQHHCLLRVTVKGDRELAARTLRENLPTSAHLTVEARLAEQETDFTVVAERADAVEERIFAAVAAQCPQLMLTRLENVSPSLEDIFLELTQGGGRLTEKGAGA